MTRKLFAFLLFLTGIIFFNTTTLYAQGDLMIMPKRVVFEGRERSKEINLANTGQDTAVYAISFINYRMTENGNFQLVETPDEGQRFATDFLRYFPRRVTLAPNEAQTIRVQVRGSGNMEPGEYRSHMYFRAVEKQTALGQEEEKDAEGISINIKTVFGISIPIIIRNGKSTTEVELEQVELDLSGESPRISMVIRRTGNMSVYGNIIVHYISPTGERTEIGKVKGLSVYTPNNIRNFDFRLENIKGLDLDTGKLEIQYTNTQGVVLDAVEKKLE